MKKLFDIKTLNIIIGLCIFWKAICPFLGFLYLFAWLTMVFEDPIFYTLDAVLGWLPSHIDALFLHQTDIFGMNVPMGYIYSAILIIISIYATMKIQIYASDSVMLQENEAKVVEIKKQDKIAKKEYKIKDETYKLTHFFGVLELKLEYFSDYNKQKDKLETLKKEYLKMILNKLSSKYQDMEFELTDELFIISKDFLNFDPLLSDIAKLFKIFVQIDKEKSIQTTLLLSFSCGNENNNSDFIRKILKKVNQLKYINKIIVIDKFIDKYKATKSKNYDFISLGLSKLEMDNFNDIDVDLYYLKKK